jgi:hypothetical protein
VNRARICKFVALSALAACTYGPPERQREFDEFMTAPDSSVTAYLRGFDALRWANGISAFPDGGIPKKAGSGVDIFLCQRGQDVFRQIARVNVPAPMQDRGQYHLAGSVSSWFSNSVEIPQSSLDYIELAQLTPRGRSMRPDQLLRATPESLYQSVDAL